MRIDYQNVIVADIRITCLSAALGFGGQKK